MSLTYEELLRRYECADRFRLDAPDWFGERFYLIQEPDGWAIQSGDGGHWRALVDGEGHLALNMQKESGCYHPTFEGAEARFHAWLAICPSRQAYLAMMRDKYPQTKENPPMPDKNWRIDTLPAQSGGVYDLLIRDHRDDDQWSFSITGVDPARVALSAKGLTYSDGGQDPLVGRFIAMTSGFSKGQQRFWVSMNGFTFEVPEATYNRLRSGLLGLLPITLGLTA